jgi:hypothetical protein
MDGHPWPARRCAFSTIGCKARPPRPAFAARIDRDSSGALAPSVASPHREPLVFAQKSGVL